MLADGFSTARGHRAAYVHRDAVNGVLRGRRGARLTALTSGGAIPDNADYDVVLEPAGQKVGTVNEDFAVESLAGDVFQLGNTSYASGASKRDACASRMRRAPRRPFRSGSAKRRAAPTSCPMPCRGCATRCPTTLDRTQFARCGRCRGRQRHGHVRRCDQPGRRLPRRPARRSARCRRTTRSCSSASSTSPAACSSSCIRRSAAASIARGASRCASASASSSTSSCRRRPPKTRSCCRCRRATASSSRTSRATCTRTPCATCSCRRCSPRRCSPRAGAGSPRSSLALPRFRGGRKVPAPLQRMRAEDLMAVVFPDQIACARQHRRRPREVPDHPLVRQAIDDCLHEAMDIDGLERCCATSSPAHRGRRARPARRPRRSRSRSSPRVRTPTSTTRRSRSAARRP